MQESQRERVEWELLWLRCRRGDPDSLERLVRQLERPLYYFIRRIVTHDADAWDVLQQCWIRVFAGLGGVRDAGALKPWLYRTARNTALNHLRADRRYRAAVEDRAEQDLAVESPATAWEDAEEAHRALDQLALPYREALTLYFLEEMSVREMAAALEIPEGTVKSRLHHGRRQLRALLHNPGGEQS